MKLLKRDGIHFRQLFAGATQEMLSRSALISEQLKTEQVFMALDIIEPGKRSSASHRHSEIDEIILVLRGSPTLFFGEKKESLSPGTFICLEAKDDEFHHLMNETAEDVEVLTISKPRGLDRVIYKNQALPGEAMT